MTVHCTGLTEDILTLESYHSLQGVIVSTVQMVHESSLSEM